MKRAIILLMDSFGIGAAPDAAKFGDVGANTFGHLAEVCAAGKADKTGLRSGRLQLPNLVKLGLGATFKECNGKSITGMDIDNVTPEGKYGCAAEISYGKDTPSGHWEIAGVPILFDWGMFKPDFPSFPSELIDEFVAEAKIPGILGNKAASGTVILEELGDEHVKTGKPIVYTSADSVFQIACHEETFGLERLYEICKIARKIVDKYNIGRVIARPFTGTSGHYVRTKNRHDYSVPPPAPTLLDKLKQSGGTVIGIGKIPDIFAHIGISKEVPPASGNMDLFDSTLNEVKIAGDRTLIFTNFVDFDMLYGHRRDVAGYAHALEEFDARLPELEKLLQPGDVVIITADHGCDPSFKGTDHTREYIPVLAFGPGIEPGSIGKRKTFADIGQSLAKHLAVAPFQYGESFL
jgi:phosphopentomutase